MHFDLIEPLKALFKDEVRAVGAELGLPDEIVHRQPFPGPGLAVRIIGDITRREARDAAAAPTRSCARRSARGTPTARCGSTSRCCPTSARWASWATSAPTGTRSSSARSPRADAMTADWARLPHELLAKMSNRIINEVDGINRVAYDITSKPPGTIEWE